MATLEEIEAAAGALSQEQQRSLLKWLDTRVRAHQVKTAVPHSVLDIAPVSLGKMLRPLHPDDDLLGEMLEE